MYFLVSIFFSGIKLRLRHKRKNAKTNKQKTNGETPGIEFGTFLALI